ncbi:hypothetical protein CB0940_03497 [Cercospora beticola]|uniref:RNA polymerase I-specific transcription initiation factor rrn5 n=1 Tax=Cercospora beticola TaxID=122368 RepID=A0A2G5I3Y1_CERBT|nr:hypothetical protein CB0940_03497 [Cercospora beticola]PIA99468.1 hypothetical protein CB0940_03497 [Cercospora beticola]WPB00671.1 hypothetical protein RHO25_005291 [Cercospora beticola]CAK1361094.1 unnamed protein product [Cercospora beticola]
MAADTSEDEYIDSEQNSDSADSGSERQGTPAHTQSSRDHQAERGTRQNVDPQERSGASSRGLTQEPDTVVEACTGQSRERQPRPRQPRQKQPRSRQASSRRSSGDPDWQSQSSRSEVGGSLTTEYRDLLNDMIADARGRETNSEFALTGSQIEASFWSAREKNALFRALERHGSGDLPRLARSVHTKSQFEIQLYTSLLREGLAVQHKADPRKTAILGDISAAAEISIDCETALENAADTLSSRVEKHEQTAEHEKYNENWLVDAEAAEQEEQNYEQAIADAAETNNDVSNTDAADSISSDQAFLLRQAAFLQLSRNLFMNNGEQEDLSWHHVNLVTDVADEPAIFRRALGDLQAIAISLTRRLVQVSIFQAMTRLRAHDSTRTEWTPLPAVRETDVRTAIEVLGLRPNWRQYWAFIPRRSRVIVYSDSKKYNDGRPGTKAGHALTYDEVEAELGDKGKIVQPDIEVDEQEVFEEEIDEFMANSDAFTDDHDQSGDSEMSRSKDSKQKSALSSSSRKRKRALSPDVYSHLQDEHADAVDLQHSASEQRRLWELLRLTPPESLAQTSTMKVPPPSIPAGAAVSTMQADWRNSVEIQAEWESESGIPTREDFRATDVEGRARRKRRQVIETKVRERLNLGQALGVDATHAHIEDHDEVEASGEESPSDHGEEGALEGSIDD